jgi:hypothetical protein
MQAHKHRVEDGADSKDAKVEEERQQKEIISANIFDFCI